MIGQYVDVTSPDVWKLYFYSYVFATFMMYAVEITLMLLAVHFIDKAFYDKSGRYGWKEIFLLLIPSAAGFSVHLLRKSYEALFLRETSKDIIDFYTSYRSIALLLSVCYVITLASIIIELYLFQGLIKKQEEEKNVIVTVMLML